MTSEVTTCLNSWKFVTVSYFNSLLLWKTYVQRLISKPLLTDSKSNSKSLFDDIAYVRLNNIFQSMIFQTRNQEFFRTGKVSENKSTLINI